MGINLKHLITAPAFFFLVMHTYAQINTEQIQFLKASIDTCTTDLKKTGLYNDLAWEYSFSNYDSSLHYTKKAIKLANKIGDAYWIATSTEMMAMLNEISGNTERAIELYLKVIGIREQLHGKGLETTYNNLGILFQTQGNYHKAYEYYAKSYELEKARNNTEGIVGSLINMSVSLSRLNQQDSAYYLLKSAEQLAQKNHFDYLLQNVYLDLSNYYILKNKLDSAFLYCQMLLQANEKDSLKSETLIIVLQTAGDVYLKKDSVKTALQFYNQVETLASELNNLEYSTRLYQSKAKALAQMGRYQQAYTYMQKYSQASDSLINKESLTILHDLETRYQTEKKEHKIAQLELETARSINQRNLFIVLVVGVVMGLGFLYYLLRIKSKSNLIISQSLAEKEVLLREIHHRVKNNLQIISSLLNLQSRYVTDEQAVNAINEGKSRVKAMSLIHQKLYQKDNLTGIEMPSYIQSLVDSLFQSYGVHAKQVKFISKVENLRLDVDTAIPLGLILNEWVTNALKYAFVTTPGNLTIFLFQQNKEMVLKVQDDGEGFKSNAKSDGYGMRLVNSLARKLKGNVTYQNQNGTICTLTITKFKLV